jgi:hypothetical protein
MPLPENKRGKEIYIFITLSGYSESNLLLVIFLCNRFELPFENIVFFEKERSKLSSNLFPLELTDFLFEFVYHSMVCHVLVDYIKIQT